MLTLCISSAFRTWHSRVDEGHKDRPPSTVQTSDLKYIVFGEFSESEETIDVIEDIWSFDPALKAEDYVTGIATYTPSDDNFYALIGTQYGKSAVLMLERYPNSFATRNPNTRAVKKVKSIRDIKIAGGGYEIRQRSSSGESWTTFDSETSSTSDFKYPWDRFSFNMIFTLEDIDHPAGQ